MNIAKKKEMHGRSSWLKKAKSNITRKETHLKIQHNKDRIAPGRWELPPSSALSDIHTNTHTHTATHTYTIRAGYTRREAHDIYTCTGTDQSKVSSRSRDTSSHKQGWYHVVVTWVP